MHGGTNPGPPKGNQNGTKHGIYRNALSDEDKELWDALDDQDMKSLNDEIKICRIRLNRMFKLRNEIMLDPTNKDHKPGLTHMETVEEAKTVSSEEFGETTEKKTVVITRRIDIDKEIAKYISQIGHLTKIQAEIGGDNADAAKSKAQAVMEHLRLMKELREGEKDAADA